MFTTNFTRIVVGQMPAFSGYNLSLKIRDGSTYVAYNNTGINPASITSIVASKLSSLEGDASNSGKSTFALGSGTNTDMDKHTLGNLISDADFTLNSASRTNPASQGLENKCILSQTITYNGNTEITIRSIVVICQQTATKNLENTNCSTLAGRVKVRYPSSDTIFL